jgi:hypothetical protein
MRKMLVIAVAVASAPLSAAAARADCAYDLKQLSARIEHEPDKAKAAIVRKLLVRAETERRTRETECRNDVARAWAALHAPPDVAPVSPAGRLPQTAVRAPNTANQPNYYRQY